MLQNLDLDTVTFAQVQSTGDPISIEDMNEQEMVDLIIVNLARLCVAGEWDGLLTAGGGHQLMPGGVSTAPGVGAAGGRRRPVPNVLSTIQGRDERERCSSLQRRDHESASILGVQNWNDGHSDDQARFNQR